MSTEFRSFHDVWEQLPTADDARRFLETAIWGEVPICPHCAHRGAWVIKGKSARPGLNQCCACRRQFTITTKTPLHATKLDLRVWIAAMYLVITSSKGISSVVLARLLGVSQKTGWKMGHAIREMMNTREAWKQAKLTGIVEVDEAFIGGKPKYRRGVKNKRGKGMKKPQILVAVQRNGEARAVKIKDAKVGTIRPQMGEWVSPSAILMTDSARVYKSIGKSFAAHHAVNHSRKQFVDKATGAHINTAEAFTGQVERAMVGVYHILFPEHLQRYLDEITWRWNRRELAKEVRGPNSSRKHRIWKPVRVVAHMVELLCNAPGRQVRRAADFGLRWPE